MQESEFFFEDENIICKHTPSLKKTDVVIICFGDKSNLHKKGQDLFWGERLITKTGYSFVGIMAKRPNWYPKESINRAAQVLFSKISASCQIIGYGGSMGGYAAIKYSRLLKFTRTIAYVPQATIDPEIINDHRYCDLFDPILNKEMTIAQSDITGTIVMVSDPRHPIDESHAQYIKSIYPETHRIPLCFTDHHATSILAGSDFFLAILNYSENPNKENLIAVRKKTNSLKIENKFYIETLISPRWEPHSLKAIKHISRKTDIHKVKFATLSEYRNGIHTFNGNKINNLRPNWINQAISEEHLALVSWNGKILSKNTKTGAIEAMDANTLQHQSDEWEIASIEKQFNTGVLRVRNLAVVYDSTSVTFGTEDTTTPLQSVIHYRFTNGRVALSDGKQVVSTERNGKLSLRTSQINRWELYTPI
ncbi:hypothetical protein [Burkholderia sp. IDO3]|uniref:hypothetical protein n=1 Tax=Burkholderia sp. IDO3 TaxID=1705310 RepID=UPI001177F99A|nr:hypothetical protein [Burkholderia sp. IDO3]